MKPTTASIKIFNKTTQAIILCTILPLLALPGHATVITSGCAETTSCTLTELFAGGSISINDVVFNSWVFNFADGDSVDTSSVIVSGVDEAVSPTPGQSTVGLSVTFNPMLSVEFVEYDFDFITSIVGSSRLLVGSGLELIESSILGDAFVEVNNAISSGNLLRVDADGPIFDSAVFSGLTSLISDSDIQMESFDDNPVGLRQFNYVFSVAETVTPAPEPDSLLLLALGLLLIGYGYHHHKSFSKQA